jgi:hypothetical protein
MSMPGIGVRIAARFLAETGGNKRLKNALFMAAFTSLRADPESRAYYVRKTDVLYAMVRDHRHFTPAHPKAA